MAYSFWKLKGTIANFNDHVICKSTGNPAVGMIRFLSMLYKTDNITEGIWVQARLKKK